MEAGFPFEPSDGFFQRYGNSIRVVLNKGPVSCTPALSGLADSNRGAVELIFDIRHAIQC